MENNDTECIDLKSKCALYAYDRKNKLNLKQRSIPFYLTSCEQLLRDIFYNTNV